MIAPHRGCPKSFKSTITPHTLSNFQSLTKLIHLIINYFYSHCRSDWQIVLTKQNFSDSLCKGIISFLYFVAKLRIKSKTTKNNAPPPAGASLQLVPNSKFRIHNSLCRPHSHPSHYSHSSHNCPCSSHPIIPIAPTIAPHKQHNCSIFPLLKGG